MSPTPLPGVRWFAWLRHLTLRVGVLTGVYLSMILVAWLFAANRLPWLDSFAAVRNVVSGAVFALLMLIPIGYFLRSPARLFASGLLGWTVLTLVYTLMGVFFARLHSRMGPFQVFILGAALYGVVAVVAWVASMVMEARHHPVASSRRRPY